MLKVQVRAAVDNELRTLLKAARLPVNSCSRDAPKHHQQPMTGNSGTP
jgi:hypothetical protein